MNNKMLCYVSGCTNDSWVSGLCSFHYGKRARLNKKQKIFDEQLLCKVDGCNRLQDVNCSGYCIMHYKRIRRNGTTEIKQGRRRMCDVEGCDRMGSGAEISLCPTHRKRMKRHGNTDVQERKVPTIPCAVPGCKSMRVLGHRKNSPFTETYCEQHTNTMHRYGITIPFTSVFGFPPYICTFCGRVLDTNDTKQTNIDHKIPQSRGGTNELENLHLVCYWCNQAKRNLTSDEFFDLCYSVVKFYGPTWASK